MINFIKSQDWKPLDNFELEPVALEVVKSNLNCYVIAGPGAGKTELLAQRASFLLQTGICVPPRKILALSYKKDAAKNLSDRIEKRVGKDLATRFISMTYDAFAKGIVDHFLRAIPERYRPSPDYQILNSIVIAYQHLYPSKKIDIKIRKALNEHFLFNINKLPLDECNIIQKRLFEIWQLMLKGDDEALSYLTFPMIAILAEFLLRENPMIMKALKITFSHIFLDEFQDTTKSHYYLLKTCFSDKGTILTAVGDQKQRIMIWAGADKDIFKNFQNDFNAREKKLLMNHRSAPRLIEIQKIFINKIAGSHEEINVNKKWQSQDGIARVWFFKDDKQEADVIASNVKIWLSKENLEPRNICIIVRQRPEIYASLVIDVLKNRESILIRNESDFQDLLSEECSKIILDIILLAFSAKSPEACLNTIEIINLLNGIDASVEEVDKLRLIDNNLTRFLEKLRQSFLLVSNQNDLEQRFCEILKYLDIDILKNVFPQYKRGTYLSILLQKLSLFLWQEYKIYKKWNEAILALYGKYSIPVMTIHKSKGLEYDTVIFLGLEDDAFCYFEKQKEEETCAFFVALSRAERRVIFTYCKRRNLDNNSKELRLQSWKKIKTFYESLSQSNVIEVQNYSNVS